MYPQTIFDILSMSTFGRMVISMRGIFQLCNLEQENYIYLIESFIVSQPIHLRPRFDYDVTHGNGQSHTLDHFFPISLAIQFLSGSVFQNHSDKELILKCTAQLSAMYDQT
jgi:hypothetical protein